MRRADTHADEQHDGHKRIASQIVKMTDPARLSADARKFTICMVDKVRQHDQEGARVDPGESAMGETQRAGEPDQQAQRGQMIRRDPGVDERRD
ncbi:hypothetical protein GCM10011400_48330 [Paraburkholderia caffeinilytica]|uniref:Uncharacterized protein n=1 Tax=Paraburkholderia caffeinilytica TaxID=1761016 RepID=A0ABQ1NCY3_9BURK|nr:hypothetical protein GCM10011400_48330 [Paraburkholderia caffeinilytica]